MGLVELGHNSKDGLKEKVTELNMSELDRLCPGFAI
jgi:hypothetical protein